MNEEKICGKCRQKKNIENFYLINKYGTKRQPICKLCDKEAGKENYKNNLPKNRATRKKWQEEKRELHNKHQRNYYARKREGATWGLFI